MASRRQELLDELRSRLRAIHVADGFQTDAGDTVFMGETPTLGPDDPETALAIVVGDDSTRRQGVGIFLELPIEIHAVAKATAGEAWLTVEAMLADIKRAIELDDELLIQNAKLSLDRGPTRTLERESGSATIGVAVTYTVSYSERWGQP